MALKDYYHLLNVAAGADSQAVKKAFRKLAMQYHPDKNQSNQLYNEHFKEIQEAYEVLSDPSKRENYHYQRWLEKSMGHELDSALTADQIIRLFVKTEQYISTTDWFKTNKEILLLHLLELFNDARLKTLEYHSDKSVAARAIEVAMRTLPRLDSTGIETLKNRFSGLFKSCPDKEQEWQRLAQTTQKKEAIAAFKVPLIIFATLLICLILFLITR